MLFEREMHADDDNVSQEWEASQVRTTIGEIVHRISAVHVSTDTCSEVPPLPSQRDRQELRIEELKKQVTELEERNARAQERARSEKEKFQNYQTALSCVVCQDLLRNPQSLECGHLACYACLRQIWTRTPTNRETMGDSESIISTDEEDADDEAEPDSESFNSAALISRRHRFPSVVHRAKVCPTCQKPVTRRPVQDYVLRDIIELMNSNQRPFTVRHKSTTTMRKDLWHGIFPAQPEFKSTGIQLSVLQMLLSHYYFTPHNLLYIRGRVDDILQRRQRDLSDARVHEQRFKSALDKIIAERDQARAQAAASRTMTCRDIPADPVASLIIPPPNFVFMALPNPNNSNTEVDG